MNTWQILDLQPLSHFMAPTLTPEQTKARDQIIISEYAKRSKAMPVKLSKEFGRKRGIVGNDPQRVELEGEAWVALTEAAGKFVSDGLTGDLDAYLATSIRNRLFSFNDSIMGPCAKTAGEQQAAYEELDAAYQMYRMQGGTDSLDDYCQSQGKQLPEETTQPCQSGIEPDVLTEGKNRAADVMEQALGVCQNDLERNIIRLRAAGLSDPEIATKLHRAVSTVNSIRNKLMERYDLAT
jgi:hypothetical protein